MEKYIQIQIQNMVTSLKIFEQTCEMSVGKDGIITKAENREIKRIKKATEKYAKKLEAIK